MLINKVDEFYDVVENQQAERLEKVCKFSQPQKAVAERIEKAVTVAFFFPVTKTASITQVN